VGLRCWSEKEALCYHQCNFGQGFSCYILEHIWIWTLNPMSMCLLCCVLYVVSVSAGKAKAGMVHSVSRWTQGVQVKLWDPLTTHAIPERLRGVFTTKRYTNTRLPCLYLYLPSGNYCEPDVFDIWLRIMTKSTWKWKILNLDLKSPKEWEPVCWWMFMKIKMTCWFCKLQLLFVCNC